MRKPSEFYNFPMPIEFGPYRAVVKHWVDADTCDVLLDVGLNKYAYETLRIRGIDGPEIYGPKEEGELERGHAARDYALSIAPIDTPVIVTTYKDTASFGRYIADLTFSDGSDFAAEMVNAGHAEWSE